MKHVKSLGLLAIAATALMAFAGTASASTATSPAGTTYTSNITATSSNIKLHGAFVTIECAHSEFKGKIESHGAGVDAGGNLSSLTFTGCNYATTTTKSGGFRFTSLRAFFSFGMWFHVHTSVGACGFTTNNTQIGSVTTGSNAVIDINSAKVPRTSGNFLCGSSGTLTGTYTITTPSSLDID